MLGKGAEGPWAERGEGRRFGRVLRVGSGRGGAGPGRRGVCSEDFSFPRCRARAGPRRAAGGRVQGGRGRPELRWRWAERRAVPAAERSGGSAVLVPGPVPDSVPRCGGSCEGAVVLAACGSAVSLREPGRAGAEREVAACRRNRALFRVEMRRREIRSLTDVTNIQLRCADSAQFTSLTFSRCGQQGCALCRLQHREPPVRSCEGLR